ncbi:hypothetical protein ABZX12_41275 [Kribbella sp. NPDC003505]|uniref:hypothetical protein n=1 Tax=Kribbella sp. NPDC003505 TaxID=3154448 RepID=UPI0033A2B8ED
MIHKPLRIRSRRLPTRANYEDDDCDTDFRHVDGSAVCLDDADEREAGIANPTPPRTSSVTFLVSSRACDLSPPSSAEEPRCGAAGSLQRTVSIGISAV